MARYALLVAPSSNRVYAEAATRLAAAELAVFAGVVPGGLGEITETSLGGLSYVSFEAGELTADGVATLSNLSAMFALFEVVDGDLLRPVRLERLDRYDDDLITIQKYQGKTNEQFTKLLLNVTLLSAGLDLADRSLVVFDPMAGRGTTLNQALMYGYDALGTELDGKDFDAYAAFLKTWLKRKRLKHRADVTPVRREKKLIARRLEVTVAGEQKLVSYNIDALKAREVIKPRSADLIVTDAPYGVAHGAHHNGLSRKPADLLRQAMPGWAEILRPGGALGIAFNTHTAPKAEIAAIVERCGLRIAETPGFEHWVDQAITRDILVACK
ncbi:TRM11 family SAM-dependent methyltransferase [Longispora albida]|uniref:TRM11 family SAM-dependent methyltransferase n=1 Tax=Longispora albida TaxID=203523 RepID=UPI000475F495|nr:restriction endonuclease subunit M [Longispora albida]